jgi:hypothetical protein
MDTVPADFWDQYGRGPMLRAWQDRHGIRPHLPGPGVRSMLYAVQDSVDRATQFPDQFRAMLVRAVGEVVDLMVPPLIEAEVNRRLEAARKAYAELKAKTELEVAELRKALRSLQRVPARR